MKTCIGVLAVLVLFHGANARSVNNYKKTHPVSDIIQLLKDLAAKTETEAKDEEQLYVKFEYWCKNSKKSLDKAIAEEKEKIAELEETISALELDEKKLEEQIEDLKEEIQELDEADAKATHERGETAKLFKLSDKDLADTISAVDQAITALETAETNTDFLQLPEQKRSIVKYALALGSSEMTQRQHSIASGFIQQTGSNGHGAPAPAPRPKFLADGDYAAHVDKYDFKSNSVIELLKELKKKFEDDKLAGVKAETNSLNAYDLAMAARDDSRTAAKKSKKAKEDELGDVQSELSTARGDLKDERKDLKDDTATLKQTVKACELKKTEWDERCKVREMELEAMEAAIKILAKATKTRTEAPSNPVPPPSPVLVQQRASALSLLQISPVEEAVEVLHKAAQGSKSKALDLIAQQIRAGGPFNKVINMIEKMIFRLMDEQKDEDNHKNWCDKELSKTNSSIVQKQEKMDELNANIDEAESRQQTLTREIEDDNDMIAQIAAHVKEAKEIRAIGKKENAEAIEDAKHAQSTIADAIAVLEDFYKESGKLEKEDWEFVQAPVTLPKKPATWSSPYTGVADPSDQPGGVVSVLKATSADFATMEADTLAQEATDQSTFEDDMKACAIEKAGREKSAEMKGQEKKRLIAKISELKSLLKEVEEQHAATVQYQEDLQPACVDGSSTYEARKAARTKEIEALRQAQNILTNAFNAPGPAAAYLQASAPAAAPPSFLKRKRQ